MNKILGMLGFLIPGFVFGQYQFQKLNNHLNTLQNSQLYDVDSDVHTGIQPLNRFQVDSLTGPNDNLSYETQKWLGRKLFNEHLVDFKSRDLDFSFDPLVNLQLGKASELNSVRWVNSRGFYVQGRIGKGFTFYSSFLENQATFPEYISDFIRYRQVVPGQGKSRGFGNGGFDYAWAMGEVSYAPNKFFTFTAGQGRNFFGEGYRSMVLSDVSSPYPFFRIQTSVWKIKYTNLWAQMYDLNRRIIHGDIIYAKKFLSTHYLSINLTPRWNLSVFESIVMGDTAQQRGIDASFFNPVIFYRPVEFAVGSGIGNALLGLGSSYKIIDGLQAYGQFTLDEFSIDDLIESSGDWKNKYAWQLGVKYYNAFNVKGLFTRVEWNAARPYTYSHREPLTNYAHYGQPLAHPWGANFSEFVFQAVYQHKRWEIDFQLNSGKIGLDSAGSNWGTDVYLSYDSREQDKNNSIGQGNTGTLLYTHVRLAYLVNPASGLKFELGVRHRSLTADVETTRPFATGTSTYIFAGLRTEFFNRYYDF